MGARVTILYRLVGGVIQAPFEIEVIDAMPVALTKGIGKALVNDARCEQPHQIFTFTLADHLIEHLGIVWQM